MSSRKYKRRTYKRIYVFLPGMQEIKSILIRMPNWLGDMVMASAFIKAVQNEYPAAIIDLIIKKELEFLSVHLPAHGRDYIFSKKDHEGLSGAKKFGQQISKEKEYDLFFCLPESASSAAMGNETGAKKRIGFRRAVTFLFFTNTYKRKKDIHRVEEYISLLADFTEKAVTVPPVKLNTNIQQKNNSLIININSEASSRRLPKEKAVSIINKIRKQISNEIILIGSPKEKVAVQDVYESLDNKTGIVNMAGSTSLPELVNLFAEAKGMLSTDSGPAHVANAVGTNTIVLFGAGNEQNTAPYNKQKCIVMRLGKLSCEPCTDNICKRFGTPECLLQLDEEYIVQNVIKILS